MKVNFGMPITGLSGKFGDVVFCTRKDGTCYVRKVAKPRQKPLSPKEIANLERFAVQAKDGTLHRLYRLAHPKPVPTNNKPNPTAQPVSRCQQPNPDNYEN